MKENKKAATEMTRVERIVAALQEVAKIIEVHPSDVTKAQLLKSEGKYKVTDHDLKQIPGGLSSIKRAHLPVVGKELVVAREMKETSKYIKELEDSLAEKGVFEKGIIDILNANIKPLKFGPYKKKKFSKSSLHREHGMFLTDTHYGVIIDPEEIGGKNRYDFKEACRRSAKVLKEALDFKPHAKDEVRKFHLIHGGDGIHGLLHELESRNYHSLIHQTNCFMHILGSIVEVLSKEYPEVEVTLIPGNHCRNVAKNKGQRAVSETYDSYANQVYYSLSWAFRNAKHVKFNVPKTPYAFLNLPSGRAMVVHGDHIFSKYLGNPGKSINVQLLSDAIHRFNMGEVAAGKDPVKLVFFGHVHSYANFITSDGVEVFVSPSLSGLDAFAHSLTINHNNIAQLIFESTPDFILGDRRLVRLESADEDKSLDALVPTYSKELIYRK